jgi:hypothetical protein
VPRWRHCACSAWPCTGAGSTHPGQFHSGSGIVLQTDVHTLARKIQRHFSNMPELRQSQQRSIQLGIFHLRLLTAPRLEDTATGDCSQQNNRCQNGNRKARPVGAVGIARRLPEACGIPPEFHRRFWIPFRGIRMSGRLGSFHRAQSQTKMLLRLNRNMLGVPTQNPEQPDISLSNRGCLRGIFPNVLPERSPSIFPAVYRGSRAL